ncbi:unnamed protein product [Ceutorhynchus assimilis]|uniref:RRM domain-containing protein n=1 Tax=Ceutorhynchus assimilis TaxID=467358 RepID=A0A9N9QG21_9CUCU|nr:unnamed protein product [Ceutorhynchus assimilis]
MSTFQKSALRPKRLYQDDAQLSIDLLQNHSINSLLMRDVPLWEVEETEGEDTMYISDLLGLNSPRGQLNSSDYSDGLSTPPVSPQNQNTFDRQNNYGNESGKMRISKKYQRNVSFGSTGSSPQTPPHFARAMRSESLNDSCGSNSPFDQQQFLNRSFVSESPEAYSTAASSLQHISELGNLLNSLTVNDVSESLPGPEAIPDVDLEYLNAVRALQYLQNNPGALGSFFPTSPAAPLGGPNTNSSLLNLIPQNYYQLDRAARFHRSSASLYDAVCTWSGNLPARTEHPYGYSSKVFLGGVPWDISEQCLVQIFRQFGQVRVEWPGKDRQVSQPKGYAYLIMDSEKAVKTLIKSCDTDYTCENFFFKMGSKRMKSKDVQIIPWFLSDSNYTKSASQKLDASKTVFVGALHGMLTAYGLAVIMNDLFGGVVYAGIDTDKYKYPIGSGRVTFNNSRSYMKAIAACFIDIKTTKFTKKVQVDPYLEDSLCSICGFQQGPYFCRDLYCFKYFCRTCWVYQHVTLELFNHSPMCRNSKNSPFVGFGKQQRVAAASNHRAAAAYVDYDVIADPADRHVESSLVKPGTSFSMDLEEF